MFSSQAVERSLPPVRDQQIEELSYLVKFIAYRLAMRIPPHINVNDLINAGMIGLLESLDRFDPNRGVKIETFAYIRIKGAMLDELRDMDWASPSVRQKSRQLQDAYLVLEARLGRTPNEKEVADALSMSLEKYQELSSKIHGSAFISLEDLGIREGEKGEAHLRCLMDKTRKDPEVNIHFGRVKKILSNAIGAIQEKEKTVLSLYYYDELTLKEIGDVIGLAKSRVCQLHSKGILELKRNLNFCKEI